MAKFWQNSEGKWSIWLKNQYPESSTSKIINDALQKKINKPQWKNGGEKVNPRGQKMPSKDVKPFFSRNIELTSACNWSKNWEKNVKIDNNIHNAKTMYLPTVFEI